MGFGYKICLQPQLQSLPVETSHQYLDPSSKLRIACALFKKDRRKKADRKNRLWFARTVAKRRGRLLESSRSWNQSSYLTPPDSTKSDPESKTTESRCCSRAPLMASKKLEPIFNTQIPLLRLKCLLLRSWDVLEDWLAPASCSHECSHLVSMPCQISPFWDSSILARFIHGMFWERGHVARF